MLFIATCNSIASLPPELRRRFTLGTFFFDLPSDEERETIWGIYLKKYNVSGELPNDEGWTGAEIKECCRKAHRLGITLMQASRYIVPVSRSAAEQIKALRQMASGKFISASTPGVYQYQETSPASRTTRHAGSGWAAHRHATLESRGLNTPCQTMPGSQVDLPQRILTQGSWQARVPY
jgi:SpoVK/Ycf46/Vps4 family AAA+-type ATPase